MAEKAMRRRTRGSAWYWQQTDSWYFTPPSTKRRVRLKDETGRPIRGEHSKADADLALARVKADGKWRPEAKSDEQDEWTVAKVCSAYIEHMKERAEQGAIVGEHRDGRSLSDVSATTPGEPKSETIGDRRQRLAQLVGRLLAQTWLNRQRIEDVTDQPQSGSPEEGGS